MKTILSVVCACALLVVTARSDERLSYDEYVARMERDALVVEGPVGEFLGNYFRLMAARDGAAIVKMLDVDFEAKHEFPVDRVLELLPTFPPTGVRILDVTVIAAAKGPERGIWLLEVIVEFEGGAGRRYGVWYLVRRQDELFLLTIPFLKGPGGRILSFEISGTDARTK